MDKRFELQLLSPSDDRLESAKVRIEIGWAFREKGAITDDVKDYASARQNLNQAIAMLKGLDKRSLKAKAYYYLGIVEMSLAELGEESMASAIKSFHSALKYVEKDENPRNWSMIKFKLGNAWYFNHEGNYLENLNQSIAEFTESLAIAHIGQWEETIDDIENNLSGAELKRAYLLRTEGPSCFISYAWEDPEHMDWVRKLAEDLSVYGVRVNLDQWDESEMYDIPKYMETSIREADFVLLICTPMFTAKADYGEGGVGYEKNVITGEIFTKTSERRKFLPLLRSGGPEVAIPSYLKASLYYDFRDSSTYRPTLHSLLKRIFDIPKHPRPTIEKDPLKESAFPDSRRYRIEYLDDPEFDEDFFRRPVSLDAGPISLDARYRLDRFMAKKSSAQFEIVSMEVDKDRSNWYSDPGILRRYRFDAEYNGSRRRSYDGRDSFHPSLRPYYHDAAWHFQQGDPDPNKRKLKDPVLDITVLNLSSHPVVLTSIGVCPLALWSIPKMIHQPKVIPRFDVFYLRCDFEKLLGNILLSDPVFVPPNSPLRFSIALIEYSEEVLRFRSNESLIAFVFNGTQDSCFVSKTIYLGVNG